MVEITMMASEAKDSVHERHVYEYFTATEKFVRTAVPQLVADYLDQFRERLVAEIVEKSIGKAAQHLKISI